MNTATIPLLILIAMTVGATIAVIVGQLRKPAATTTTAPRPAPPAKTSRQKFSMRTRTIRRAAKARRFRYRQRTIEHVSDRLQAL
ncbi:MAG: hypothetical protein ACYTF0_04385 [Planctomycetota bacterium]|jgi:hypothetical protein